MAAKKRKPLKSNGNQVPTVQSPWPKSISNIELALIMLKHHGVEEFEVSLTSGLVKGRFSAEALQPQEPAGIKTPEVSTEDPLPDPGPALDEDPDFGPEDPVWDAVR